MVYRINTKEQNCPSSHPFDPYNVNNANKFIVGTIPPHRFSNPKKLLCGDSDWFYGSKSNSFWDIMKEACCPNDTHSLCDPNLQKKFCTGHQIGIFDMIKKCTRKNNCSSSDNDLHNIELMNVCELLKNNSNESLIFFFTSRFAADLFNRATGSKINLTVKTIQKNIQICNRECDVIILYSPSPSWSRNIAELKDNKNKSEIRIKQYRQIC